MTENKDLTEEPRKKRKYTKRAKMLLRSNNDYIDHTYWPKMYAQSKKKWAKIEAKYGVKRIENAAVSNSPITIRKLTIKQLNQMEIESCAIYGVKCSQHNMVHTSPQGL